MYNAKESPLIAADIALHILKNGIHKLDRDEAEDQIVCDVLAGYLPPITQYEVDLSWKVIADVMNRLEES